MKMIMGRVYLKDNNYYWEALDGRMHMLISNDIEFYLDYKDNTSIKGTIKQKNSEFYFICDVVEKKLSEIDFLDFCIEERKDYCTNIMIDNGDCTLCSYSNYGVDCRNNPYEEE